MQVSIEKYLENLKLVIRNIPNKTESIIQANKERILDLNREEQLYMQGEDADGDRLKEYAYFTIQIKQLVGQPFDRTTLKYSGKFYDGFRYEFDKQNYTLRIFSVDRKTPLLISKYGSEIFGLNKSNKQYLEIEIIKKELDEWMLKYLS